MPTTNRMALNPFAPRFAAISGMLALFGSVSACGDVDGNVADASFRDGAVTDMSRPDSSATDGAIRDGAATLDGDLTPFDMMVVLRDGDIGDGDIGEDAGGRDGSLATCDVGSCAPGYTCCYEDGSCVPLGCTDCCTPGDGGGPRADFGVAGDLGIGGRLDAGDGIGFFCGAIACAAGEACCFSTGLCVPAGCPECCDILPPPPPAPPPF